MEKPYVVGIDIGGTNTVFGVVDARGTILYSSSIKTGKYTDVDDYVSELANGLKLVIDQAGGVDKIKGIGVGAPYVISPIAAAFASFVNATGTPPTFSLIN